MNKKIFVPTVLFLLVLPASIFILSKEKVIRQEEPEINTEVIGSLPILFYSDQCSHCAALEVFLEENKAAEKVPYEHKNIRTSNENQDEISEKAAACGFSGSVDLPFLWDGENGDKCYAGQAEVTAYFQDKLNAK